MINLGTQPKQQFRPDEIRSAPADTAIRAPQRPATALSRPAQSPSRGLRPGGQALFLAAPAAPTNLTGTVSGTPSVTVTLTWANNATPGSATQMTIERAADSSFTTGLALSTAAGNATTFTDTKAVAGTTYFYRVRAENASTFSAWSDDWSTALAAPSAVIATITGPPVGVGLGWIDNDDNPAATRIHIQRAADAGFTTGLSDFIIDDPTADTYIDTTVVEGAAYYYRVRAENQTVNINSAWSGFDPITVTTVPAAPIGLTGKISGTPSLVTLKWTNNATTPAATLVLIQRATDSGFTAGVTDFTVGPTVATYTDTPMAGTYYYRVRAENDLGFSTWSNAFSTVPGAPTGLTGKTTATPSVVLTWANNDPAGTQIHVQRAPDCGFTTGLADFTAGGTATTYTDSTVVVAPANTYCYRVRAENGLSNSAWSNTFTTVPGAPTGLTAATTAAPSVVLTWTNPAADPTIAAATLVHIQRATDSGFTAGVKDLTVGPTVAIYTDTTVVAGTYYYRVRAENQVSNSDWSNTASILVATVPAAPSGLGATIAGASVVLAWTNNAVTPSATGVRLQRATDSGFSTGLAEFPLGPTVPTYTDTNVAPGTTYYYRVRAENQINDSAWSSVVTIAIPASPPAPTNLVGTASAPGTGTAWVNLSWAEDPAATVTGFTVQVATNAAFTTGFLFSPVGASARAASFTGLLRNTKYYVRIQAVNGTQVSAWLTTSITTPR